MAQLAQFASLEAAEGTNSRLDTLLTAQASNTKIDRTKRRMGVSAATVPRAAPAGQGPVREALRV